MVPRWLLSIGGAVILAGLLAPANPPPWAAAAAAAAPLRERVDLLQTTYYANARGGLTFVGVAQNNTGQALAGLDVALTLLGADNRPVALGVAGDYGRAYLPTGARLPFSLALPAVPRPWVRERWEVVPHFYDPAWFLDQQLAPGLHVVGMTRQPPEGANPAWSLRGTIQNTDPRPARLIAVHAALYDARHRLLDATYVNVPTEEIAPDGRTSFTLAFPRARLDSDPVAQDVFLTGVKK